MDFAIAMALAYGLLNGFHDSANAVAAPVVTRAATPAAAVSLTAAFNVIGALVAGGAVAGTVAGIATVSRSDEVAVTGAALVGAVLWGLLTWWWGFPSSSSHSLVGGLAGAAIAAAGPSAVHWGGLDGLRPVGVIGVLVWLALSTVVALPVGFAAIRLARRSLRRATRGVAGPISHGEVVSSVALALAHGFNDSQKTTGVIVVVLIATGHLSSFSVPFWVKALAGAVLGIGTAFGGWRIVGTLGRGIYRLRALDGLVAQGASAGIVFAASAAGAPVSTTDIVAPAIVGVGAGRRMRHVRWSVTRDIGLSWIATLPASGALAALAFLVWRSIS